MAVFHHGSAVFVPDDTRPLRKANIASARTKACDGSVVGAAPLGAHARRSRIVRRCRRAMNLRPAISRRSSDVRRERADLGTAARIMSESARRESAQRDRDKKGSAHRYYP